MQNSSSFRRGHRGRPNSPHRPRYGGQKRRNNGKQSIDPSKFVNAAVEAKLETPYESKHQFADFGFIAGLQANLDTKGYKTPTAIQDGSIPASLEGKDVIGLANTGTGKTAAFVLPIIHQLKTTEDKRTALIIAPTRELATQIDDEFRAFAKGLQLYSTVCVGGMNIRQQIQQLNRHPQVIIGTPGRLKDLVQQRALNLSRVGWFVLDEADRMLDMGFLPDINFLIQQLPEKRQSLCFSATITPEISRLLDKMLKDPVTVSVRTTETSDHVEQNIVKVSGRDEKLAKLQELLAQPDFDRVLVFGETKFGVQRLADTLSRAGIPSEAIHGNKSQPQRQRALKAFKDGRVSVLVATDVAARGLDIPLVSHVINYDQPQTYDDYIHRIGRTGRAGNRGHALTFVD
ncbi:MAG: DEAD/DEAH box helicase [Candidatus Saccharibacteria bacterium]